MAKREQDADLISAWISKNYIRAGKESSKVNLLKYAQLVG